jgi:hypothetical protein
MPTNVSWKEILASYEASLGTRGKGSLAEGSLAEGSLAEGSLAEAQRFVRSVRKVSPAKVTLDDLNDYLERDAKRRLKILMSFVKHLTAIVNKRA